MGDFDTGLPSALICLWIPCAGTLLNGMLLTYPLRNAFTQIWAARLSAAVHVAVASGVLVFFNHPMFQSPTLLVLPLSLGATGMVVGLARWAQLELALEKLGTAIAIGGACGALGAYFGGAGIRGEFMYCGFWVWSALAIAGDGSNLLWRMRLGLPPLASSSRIFWGLMCMVFFGSILWTPPHIWRLNIIGVGW